MQGTYSGDQTLHAQTRPMSALSHQQSAVKHLPYNIPARVHISIRLITNSCHKRRGRVSNSMQAHWLLEEGSTDLSHDVVVLALLLRKLLCGEARQLQRHIGARP